MISLTSIIVREKLQFELWSRVMEIYLEAQSARAVLSWSTNVEARDTIHEVPNIISKLSNAVKDPMTVVTLWYGLQKLFRSTIECKSMLGHVNPFCQPFPLEIVTKCAAFCVHFGGKQVAVIFKLCVYTPMSEC